MDRGGFVYILANRRQGALYIGVTSDLMRRVSEHRLGLLPGFSREHDIKRLVWMEQFADIALGIAREKQLKKWNRDWKIRLIEAGNPGWDDLAVSMLGFEALSAIPARIDGQAMDPRLRGDDG